MSLPLTTTGLAVLTIGLGLALLYFGYSVVTQFTSLVGGLVGALVGGAAAQTLAGPVLAAGPLGLLLVAVVGAVLGAILGSWLARAAQRFAVVAGCALAVWTLAYATLSAGELTVPALTKTGGWWTVPTLAAASGGWTVPLVGSLLVGAVGAVLAWRFYLPFLGVVTSALGAGALQWGVRHWSGLLPVLRPETWTFLGANAVVWMLLAGSGAAVQYRRYRAVRSRARLAGTSA